MARQMIPLGTCDRCRRARPVWRTTGPRPVDLGDRVCEPLTLDLCDDCDLLDRLADPAYRQLCWPAAERIEASALAAGGVPPNAEV